MENKTNLCPECDLHQVENGKCKYCGFNVPEDIYEGTVEVIETVKVVETTEPVTEVKPKKAKKVEDDV